MLKNEQIISLSERVAKLEEYFSEMTFLTKEMKNKILHFQSRRDFLSAKSVLDHAEPEDYGKYYFKGGSTPQFSINGVLHEMSVKKVTAMEYIPALRVLLKIVADKGVLEDFIALGGELVCKERGPVRKELQEIKNACKELMVRSKPKNKR